MYVAVKGGERAIDAAHAWLAAERRGDTGIAALSVAQIRTQLALAVNRVMAEGSLHDPDLAALAIKQARGDLIEAVFLIRAYRTTLPRLGSSRPINTGEMALTRRISATFKDLPGGQILGPTFDYTHRLLDFALMAEGEAPLTAPPSRPSPTGGEAGASPTKGGTVADKGASPPPRWEGDGGGGGAAASDPVPHVVDFLSRDGLIQTEPPSDVPPADLTREPMELPA